jgi:hypothetical protein
MESADGAFLCHFAKETVSVSRGMVVTTGAGCTQAVREAQRKIIAQRIFMAFFDQNIEQTRTVYDKSIRISFFQTRKNFFPLQVTKSHILHVMFC